MKTEKSKKPAVVAPTRQRLDKTAMAAIADAPEGQDDALLTTTQTAAWLRVSPKWLEKARCRGYGPPFIKVTPRCVRYRKGDLIAYLRNRTFLKDTAKVA
jgi:hypothetical protein